MGRARGPGGQRVLRPVAALSTPSDGERRRSRPARVLRAFTQPARYSALLAGAVPVLAFPSLDLEFLAWVGLVPGLLLLRAAPTAREAAVRGWWFGAGYLLMALYWLTPNLGPGLLLAVVVLGVPWAAVGLAAWQLLRGPATPASPATPATPASSVLRTLLVGPTSPTGPAGPAGPTGPSLRRSLAAVAVLPSCWVVIDWIRSWQGIGGPWAVYGASQWQHPVVLALAAVGGIWLISFVLVAANTAIVIMLTAA